ncbi:glycosyltransferase family A protein [Aestuariivirga sp.]|uniref:glycosyltransferase family 2 protein n=1 Tax=Aestuariivirga sp. TaxID=2650926 RepID=UPI0025B9C679|nr:glycosyltransferase family A protein [Aestuariivirga sp.]MCA3555564.1 glycosyltransferase family 2 protein [Aestuariivirga sp.]
MKLTIVIPAYNEEAYLADCLRHVLDEVAQTAGREAIEVLVIDNASTDRTAEIARSFAGVRVAHEPDKGLTKARQRGLEEARGEIVGYVDADTRMPRGWCGQVIGSFAADPTTVCVSGPYVYYDLGRVSKVLVRVFWWVAVPVAALTGYMAVGGNFAARREALIKIGGFDRSIAFYGEDTDIARRLSAVGRVRFMLRLVMQTSARRLKAEGLARTAAVYVLNFVSEAVLKRPATTDYRDIR